MKKRSLLRNNLIFAASLVIMLANNISANVRVPKLISDNMVLQRDTKLKIWGWADPGEKVTVSFYGKTFEVTTPSTGKWMVEMPPMKAGGPFEMIIRGNNEVKISNILLGDVWLCSGQSNMEYTLNMLGTYENEIKLANIEEVRMLKVANLATDTLRTDIGTTGWKSVSPENTGSFSATAYFFGKELYQLYRIPIGLISSNWGGSPVEVWMSEENLKSFPDIKIAYDEVKKSKDERRQRMRLREASIPQWCIRAKQEDQGTKQKFESVLYNDNTWEEISFPGNFTDEKISGFDGVIWLRKTFDVPASMVGKDLILDLGSVDDMDDTYFNGVRIGGMKKHNDERQYKIPGKLIKEGKATIAIRLIDYGGGAGVNGLLKLYSESDAISLQGPWKYRATFNFKDIKGYIEPDWSTGGGWRPATLYNAMINPLLNYAIKGAIWYQGESNANRAYQYRQLFPAMIAEWRQKWNIGDFPFLYVQLANFLKPDTVPAMDPWPELREAQMLSLTVPNTCMASAIDLGEVYDIHPKNKHDVGKRLAYCAMSLVYNQKDVVPMGPIYESMKIDGNKVVLNFSHTAGKLIERGGPLEEFYIAGKDQKFYKAKAKIVKNTVEVAAEEVQEPVAVRYAWANNPIKANLYNAAGLPASPFRTDSWKGKTENNTKLE